MAPLAVNSKFDTQTETLLVPTFERAVELGIFTTSGIALSPISGSPSELAGVSSGDLVVSINGQSIKTPGEFVSFVRAASGDGKALRMELSRNGTTVPVTVVPKDGKIGAYVAYSEVRPTEGFRYRYPFGQAVVVAAKETVNQVAFTFEILFEILRKLVVPKTPTERQEAAQGVGGPIAVGGLFVDLVSAKVGVGIIFTVAALLSINL